MLDPNGCIAGRLGCVNTFGASASFFFGTDFLRSIVIYSFHETDMVSLSALVMHDGYANGQLRFSDQNSHCWFHSDDMSNGVTFMLPFDSSARVEIEEFRQEVINGRSQGGIT